VVRNHRKPGLLEVSALDKRAVVSRRLSALFGGDDSEEVCLVLMPGFFPVTGRVWVETGDCASEKQVSNRFRTPDRASCSEASCYST